MQPIQQAASRQSTRTVWSLSSSLSPSPKHPTDCMSHAFASDHHRPSGGQCHNILVGLGATGQQREDGWMDGLHLPAARSSNPHHHHHHHPSLVEPCTSSLFRWQTIAISMSLTQWWLSLLAPDDAIIIMVRLSSHSPILQPNPPTQSFNPIHHIR